MAKKELTFITDENGCITPSSHKLNQDGYFRKNVINIDGVRRNEMYHRYVWEQAFGKIPEGFEINHKCKNRACCNLEHLEVLEGSEHAIISNKERYADIKARGYLLWLSGMNGSQIAKTLGVGTFRPYKWMREWKSEGVETN